MTNKFYFLILLIIFNLNSNGQDKLKLSNLEAKNIITQLFESNTFKNENEGLWKPNLYDKVNMPISDDGFCHTIVDTIIYSSINDYENAIVIFSSREYTNGIAVSCHACSVMLSIATFTKVDKGWELTQFKKRFTNAGQYGERGGYYKIVRLGKDLNCLLHHAEIDGGQGYFSGYNTFYSLEGYDDYKEVFQYRYYDTNEGAVEKNGFTDNTEIKIVKTSNFYKIELITKRENKGIIKRRIFEYSEEMNSFLPKTIK